MIDFFVVGMGIAGVTITHRLREAGYSVLVIDPGGSSATKVAAGNINPVTGRQYTKSWNADVLLTEVDTMYSAMEKSLQINFLYQQQIHRPLRSIKEENNWMTRMVDDEYNGYVSMVNSDLQLDASIERPLSYGVVNRSYRVDTQALLTAYSQKLIEEGLLERAQLDYSLLSISDQEVSYKTVKARNIIFAEGSGITANPYFTDIKIEPTKGEALIIDVDLDDQYNVRDKCFVTPFQGKHWAGAGYEWTFDDDKPSQAGKDAIVKQLASFLTKPYQIVDHLAGVRPCTKDRKPIVGRHPQYTNVYLFNGLGTKGTSLAPWVSKCLYDYIIHDVSIPESIDIQRYFTS